MDNNNYEVVKDYSRQFIYQIKLQLISQYQSQGFKFKSVPGRVYCTWNNV
ncbi:hypothetical protein JHK84_039463 [Glycine max]|nr:hypothetical protein JHK84_039463 [Glycine max]